MAYTTLSNGCSNEESIYEWQQLLYVFRVLIFTTQKCHPPYTLNGRYNSTGF